MRIGKKGWGLFLLAFFASAGAMDAEKAEAAATAYLPLRGQVRPRMEAFLTMNASGAELYNQSNETIIVAYSDGVKTKKFVVKPNSQAALSNSTPATSEYLQILAP